MGFCSMGLPHKGPILTWLVKENTHPGVLKKPRKSLCVCLNQHSSLAVRSPSIPAVGRSATTFLKPEQVCKEAFHPRTAVRPWGSWKWVLSCWNLWCFRLGVNSLHDPSPPLSLYPKRIKPDRGIIGCKMWHRIEKVPQLVSRQ